MRDGIRHHRIEAHCDAVIALGFVTMRFHLQGIHCDAMAAHCGGSGSCELFSLQVMSSRCWREHGVNRATDLRRLRRVAQGARVSVASFFHAEMPRRGAGRDEFGTAGTLS